MLKMAGGEELNGFFYFLFNIESVSEIISQVGETSCQFLSPGERIGPRYVLPLLFRENHKIA